MGYPARAGWDMGYGLWVIPHDAGWDTSYYVTG